MGFKLAIFLIECAIVTIVFGAAVDVTSTTPKGKEHDGDCICGVFKTGIDATKTKPIIEKTASAKNKFPHDAKGEKDCQTLCVSMAESAKAKAPWVLCSAIKDEHVDNLKVDIYSHLCGEEKWQFTGKTSSIPICCHKGYPIKCGVGKEIIPLTNP